MPVQHEDFTKYEWYVPTITLDKVPRRARRILEEYSGISSNDMIPHIVDIHDKAFALAPYPCFGLFMFLDFSLTTLPGYDSLTKRLKEDNKTRLLDVGCSVGHDIRALVHDGVPGQQLVGLELNKELVELGYELFRDREKLKARFVIGDVLDPTLRVSEEDELFDIVHVGSLLHLFNWTQCQSIVAKIVSSMKRIPGSIIVGRQRGSPDTPGEHPKRGEYAKVSGQGTMYRHDQHSFERFWEEVGDKTDTRWKVETWFGGWYPDEERIGQVERHAWNEGTERERFRFVVTML